MPATRIKGRSRSALPYSGSTVGRSGISVDFDHGALQVHSGNRELQHADGTPFFYLATTIWFAPHSATLAELTGAFEVWRASGINVAQMSCTYLDLTQETPNRNGDVPFTSGNPSTPNDTYFDFVEDIVDLAATKGMYIALLPIWASWRYWDGDTEWIDTFSEAQMTSYGTYLANRFVSKPNIIWTLGGDADVNGIENTSGTAARIAKWDAMAAAIEAVDSTHLITFHPTVTYGFHLANYPTTPDAPPQNWALQAKSWLDFTSYQNGHIRDIDSYTWVAAYRALSPTKPVICTEILYEGFTNVMANPAANADDIRQGAYWAVFAGAAGHTYGHISLYDWDNGSGAVENADPYWYKALGRVGSFQLKYLRDLIESRPFFGHTQDDTLVTSVSSGVNRIVGCKTTNNAMIYIPRGAAFTTNWAKISGSQVKTYWFNPRTGGVTFINTYTNTGTQAFTPPTSGAGQDWVLIVDNAALNFPVPGLGVYNG